MVAHIFNTNTWEAEANLVYVVSSRTARATKWDLSFLKKKKKLEWIVCLKNLMIVYEDFND